MTTTPFGSELRLRATGAPAGATASHFRSRGGAFGAIMLLLALPITVAFDMVFRGRAEVVIHIALATGTLIIGLSVCDFATPKWPTRIACGAACALAAIFFAQGLGAFTQNQALNSFAFSQEIGGWGEAVTVTLVMMWFIALARTHGRGVTMWLGLLSAAVVIGLTAWSMVAAPVGGTPGELRLLPLLSIAWFLFVSTRRSNA